MKRSNKSLFIILGALLWVTSSCQKEDLANGTAGTGLADLQKADQVMLFMNQLCDELTTANYHELTSKKTGQGSALDIISGACGVLTVDTVSMPRVITIDFGPVNCKNGGHNYRGKVTITFTGAYREPGSVYHYFTEDFYQDNNRIDLDRTITNIVVDNSNSTANMKFKIDDYVKITFAFNLGSIEQVSDKVREWTEGVSTSNTDDDVYMLTGSHITTFHNGTVMETVIKEALRKENGYPHFVSGLEKTDRSDNPEMNFSMDYGYPEGARDNLAFVTYRNGQTEIVKL